MTRPKRQTRRADLKGIKYLTQEQLRRFFSAIPKEAVRDRLLFGLSYRFGLRPSEAISLPAGALDRHARQITVQGLKGGLTRTYSIPRDLWPLLRGWKPTGPTLLHGRQGPLSRARVWSLFKQYAKSAGLPAGYGPHSLRHSAAVHLLDAGLTTEDARDLLRHRKLSTTEVYATMSTKRRGDYLRRLEESSAVVKLR